MMSENPRRLTVSADEATFSSGKIPMPALLLGLGGAIPFGVGAFAATGALAGYGILPDAARLALLQYGAVILSFLGGVRWGVGLSMFPAPAATRHLILSIIPALVAWSALFAARPADIAILISAFAVVGVADLQMAIEGDTPRWHGRLRVMLTTIVLLSLTWAAVFGL